MKVIGWTGPGRADGIYTLEEALQRFGARNIGPVLEDVAGFFEDPATEDSGGEPVWGGIAVRPGWAKRMGLITPEEFRRARGK